MKGLLITLVVLICLGLTVGVIFYFSNNSATSCKLDEVQFTPVSPSQAQSVALAQAIRNNPPFDWTSAGYIPSNDINGEQRYYVFIFVKEGFNLNTLEKLKANLLTAQSDDEKYQFNDVATVVVSAVKEDKQIFRHFRGLPEYFVEKSNIESSLANKGEAAGSLVLDVQGTTAYFEILRNSKTTGDLIRVPNKEIVSIQTLTELKETNEKRTLSSLDNSKCEQYKKALQEARQANIAEWNKFN